MNNLLESYRILGVSVGADMAAVTTSYKRLCREYHPDISDAPNAEEMMKQVNVAYTVLRDKFKREAAFRERTVNRPVRRYTPPERTPGQRTPGQQTTAQQAPGQQPAGEPAAKDRQQTSHSAPDPRQQASQAYKRRAAEQAAAGAEAETESRKVLHDYFKALNSFDYNKAYEYLSDYDKSNITLEGFTQWREAVNKLYPMREFKISARSSIAMVTWGGSKIFHARKFRVIVTEDDFTGGPAQSGEHDKLVIIEDNKWRIFLGYKEINELTKNFEKRFETKKKDDIDKRYEEFAAGIDIEYDMLTMKGLRKAAAREVYRQQRYGSAITFAAISVKLNEDNEHRRAEFLRSAAKTLNNHLRELDLCAYAGDGVFAALFVEVGKRNAGSIIGRLVESIKNNVDIAMGKNAQIEYHFDCWSERRYADFEQINEILRKFGKSI